MVETLGHVGIVSADEVSLCRFTTARSRYPPKSSTFDGCGSRKRKEVKILDMITDATILGYVFILRFLTQDRITSHVICDLYCPR